jgi:hypothetical protein
MSSCNFNENEQMYCERFLGTVPAYFGEKIIPGNFSGKSEKYLESKKINKFTKIGKNYFWNNWNETLLDNAIFFIGSYDGEKFEVNEEIEPYVISNKYAFTNINENAIKIQ